MVNRLSRCPSYLTVTGTSSCTEFLSHPCQSKSHNERYQRSCYFINDHTYTVLKKICRRMIKDYNRCQCREKYTIFDGGNSINVRIHRSASRGDRADNLPSAKNRRCQSASTEARRLFEPDGDESNRCNGLGKYKNSNNIDDESNRRKIQKYKHGDESEKTSKWGGNEDYNRRGKRANDYKPVKEGYYNDTGFIVKSSKRHVNKSGEKDDDSTFKRAGKNGKGKGGKGDDDGSSDKDIFSKDKTEKNRKKGSKDEVRHNDDKGAKRRKEKNRKSKDDEDDENNGVVGKNGRRKGKKDKLNSEDDEQSFNTIKGKKGRKSQYHDEGNIENEKNKYKKGHKSRIDNEEKSGKKKSQENNGKKSKTFNYDENDEDGEKLTNIKGKVRKSRRSRDIDDRIITDLRKKIRKGDKAGLNINRLSVIARSSQNASSTTARKGVRLFIQNAGALQYRKLNTTRADAVRASDYLRAHMEQREICPLVCARKLYFSQPCSCNPCVCIPRSCMPCVCLNPGFITCPVSSC